jgi:hypothetical protein
MAMLPAGSWGKHACKTLARNPELGLVVERMPEKLKPNSLGLAPPRGARQRGERTMAMLPATARAMPTTFCREPCSMPSSTASSTVNTGMAGCMHVATTTPDRLIPRMKNSWLRYRHRPSSSMCRRSFRRGSVPARPPQDRLRIEV